MTGDELAGARDLPHPPTGVAAKGRFDEFATP